MVRVLFCLWLVPLCLSVAPNPVDAGLLTEREAGDVPGLYAGSLAWGDYDNDGDPDLVISGEAGEGEGCESISKVFRNTGDGRLVEDPDQHIVAVRFGSLAWGDYDNDGDLDLALSGWDNEDREVALIYRNDPPGVLVEDSRQSLVGVRYSAMAWGDYDSDGDLDLILAGMEENGRPSTRIYRNTDGVLEEDPSQAIVYVNKGSLAWGDYDGDGDLDLALSGFDQGGVRVSKIYQNDPPGVLREDKNSSSNLTAVAGGSLAWGDVDGDGDIDLALSGWDGYWRSRLEVYENDPPGFLARRISLNSRRVVGALAWGDYDNDGDLDLAAGGRTRYSDPLGLVLRNDPTGMLSEDASQQLVGLRNGVLTWVDYDNDGDLDLAAMGEVEGGERVFRILDNDEKPNQQPSSPEKLRAPPFVTGRKITFSWGAAVDEETPSSRLTYNVRVGTEEGAGDVLSGVIPVGPGNAGGRPSKTLFRSLHEDMYYWNVQTVDGGFRRSDWWPRDEILEVGSWVHSDQRILPLQGASLAWGDYDNDGDPDLVLCGEDVNGKARTLIYENEGGSLREDRKSTLEGVRNGRVVWGDYDNDGDLDLALTGQDNRGRGFSGLYTNGPTGRLTLVPHSLETLAQVTSGWLDWGDYDGDGDLDLVLIGQQRDQSRITQVVRNDQGTFVEDTEQRLQGLADGMAQWGDYDGDGDLDLVLSGGYRGEAFTTLYRNDPVGILKEEGTALRGTITGKVAWVDYDVDGDLDLMVSGLGEGGSFSVLYRNDPVGVLREDPSVDLPGIQVGSVVWGDYDNDGDPDLVMAGNDGRTAIIRVMRNDLGSLVDVSKRFGVLKALELCALGLVDYDEDGDLDLTAAGRDEVLQIDAQVYDNLRSLTLGNRRPDPPGGLYASADGDRAELHWESGTDLNGTPSAALTYDLRVGTSSGSGTMVSAKAPVGWGNVGLGTRHALRGLASGWYYWSVRSVDSGFMRSEWSEEDRFVVDTIPPEVRRVTVDPKVVGIGKAVTVIVDFHEEHSGIDTTVAPRVTFVPEGGSEVVFDRLMFNEYTWMGKGVISEAYPSGEATISVQGAADREGNVMIPYIEGARFVLDTALPTVVRRQPGEGEIGVPRSSTVRAVFSEEVDPASVTKETVQLLQDDAPVSGSFAYDELSRTVVFDPDQELASYTVYEVVLRSGIRDRVGNRLRGDVRWRFQTAKVLVATETDSVLSEEDRVWLVLPPNALRADQEVSLKALPPDDYGELPGGVERRVGKIVRFEPPMALRKPGTLSMGYTGEAQPEKLVLFWREDTHSSWERLGGTVDPVQQRITTAVRQLGTFGIFEESVPPVEAYAIRELDCQPRVFSPRGGGRSLQTDISFELGRGTDVTMEVYDESGNLIRRLVRGEHMGPGTKVFSWDGRDEDRHVVTSGFYIVVVRAGDVLLKKPVVVLNAY